MTSLPLEANAAATLAEWHGLIARRDLSGLPRLLHPDAVFRSPMAHKPYAGAPVVSMILNTVLTVFEDFAYHRQLASADGRSVVLEFSARVGERELKGIDMIRFDDDGRIVDFEVMVRPMSGLQALGEKWAGAWRPIWPRARPEAEEPAMTRITEVVVERRQLATAALRTRNLPAPEALAEGQALLAVGEFALTANNVTYAALGDALRYWEFFPAGEGLGIVPVWGFAEVLASRCPGSKRASASMATIRWPATCWSRRRRSAAAASSTPASTAGTSRRSTTSTCAAAATRSTGPPTRPCRCPAAAVHHSFLLDDFLAEHAFFGATDLLLSSASSKTAIGLAFLLQRNRAQRGQDYRIVGLTSAGNRAFVEGLGCYDEVLAYDRLDALDASGDALSVDFAGNGALLGQLHQRLGDRLRYSCLVGAAHWDQRGGLPKALPGPTPKLFFAPAQAENASGLGRRGVPGAPGGSLGRVLGLRRRLDPGPPRCRRQRGAGGLPGPAGRALGTATGYILSTAAEAAVLYCWTEVANPSRTTKRVPPMASAAPLRRRFAGMERYRP